MATTVDSGYSDGEVGDGADEVMSSRRGIGSECDPLARVLDLGGRHNWVGLAIGMAGALFVHGAGAATGLQQLYDLEAFASSINEDIEMELLSVYDLDVDEPPPPPPPPEPEPAPDEPEDLSKLPEPPAPTEKSPIQPAPPPEAAEVGQALTAEADPDAPLDLTGDQWSMVTGPGTRFAGGRSQRGGKSKQAVRSQQARAGGSEHANDAKSRSSAKREQKKDLSRPAMLGSSSSWNSCGFPAEAEMGQIDFARVALVVTVGPDGKPQRVSVVGESPAGYGFGALAQTCALGKSYQPGLDRSGNPTTSTTPRINVTFTR